MSRQLADLRVAVMMSDGIELKERMMIVVLGITTKGRKIPLGLWDGSTENATVATALLSELVERGDRDAYGHGRSRETTAAQATPAFWLLAGYVSAGLSHRRSAPCPGGVTTALRTGARYGGASFRRARECASVLDEARRGRGWRKPRPCTLRSRQGPASGSLELRR
jgi:hypothetical protein